MILLTGILIGLAIGASFRAGITREVNRRLRQSEARRREAFDLNQKLSAELFKTRQSVVKIKAFAERIHIERIINLGGSVLLPTAAESAGQQVEILALSRSRQLRGGSDF